MKTAGGSRASPEKLLRILAREFRGTRDMQQRTSIARRYADAVNRLIESEKWRSIPPFEDQLPDEWMPTPFFEHWSLRVPPRRSANTGVVCEGRVDVAILRKILPADLLDACELLAAGDRCPKVLVSRARSHAARHHAPVVVLFDTDTLVEAKIAELVEQMKRSLGSEVVGVPYDVCCCIPHIEAVFLDGTVDLQRIFPRFKTVFIKKLANTNPRGQLEALLQKGGGPHDLTSFLDEITSDEVKKIQAQAPMDRLVSFLANNRAPVLRATRE